MYGKKANRKKETLGVRARELSITMHPLYRCATTSALYREDQTKNPFCPDPVKKRFFPGATQDQLKAGASASL